MPATTKLPFPYVLLRSTHLKPTLRPFTTTPHSHGIISKDRDDTLDPSKEPTDTTAQAKDSRGATPAQQQANVVKDQSGEPGASGAAQTQAMSDSELTEKKKRGEVEGRKPGEEAVNPAVKRS